jgi:hypothetical protein
MPVIWVPGQAFINGINAVVQVQRSAGKQPAGLIVGAGVSAAPGTNEGTR